jgi:hypothetical protein
MTVTEKVGTFLMTRTSRRSFLARTTMTATALSVAPVDFMLRPGTAYAQICDCAGAVCGCSAACCDGYTEFCCTINNGINACPPGTFAGGWWKADGSIYCAGPRYYIDCMGECHGCGCGGGIFCPGCESLACECAFGNCGNEHVGCAEFRYGQCHQEIACSGRIACRVVSCTPPWMLDSTCSPVAQTDDSTADQNSGCLDSPNPAFQLLPGKATAIASGGGAVWALGMGKAPGGRPIFHWTGSTWTQVSGGAVTIAVGPDGFPWVTTSTHGIYRWTGSGWEPKPGLATCIGVGADGSVWALGINRVAGGYGIFYWTGSTWEPVSGGAVTIAVGPDGFPWVTTSTDGIYHWTGSGWTLYPGAATNIAVGANGAVWVIGVGPAPGGRAIFRWTGTGWASVTGGAVSIAIGPGGAPWMTNSAHQIYAG